MTTNKITIEQQILDPKQQARFSPAGFAIYASEGRWQLSKHLAILNRKLLDVAAGRTKRLLINFPPRHGKSEFVSKFFPSWYIGTYPNKRIIFSSYEASFAAQYGAAVRDLLEEYGPELFNIRLKTNQRAASRWFVEGVDGTDKIGGMYSVGVGGPITGKGADCLLIDDPIKNPLSIDTPIRTSEGWKVIGNICVGDKVFDQSGNLTNVVGVSAKKLTKLYRITFSDNSYIDADLNHKWAVFSRKHHSCYTNKNKLYNKEWYKWETRGNSKVQILTTQELMNNLVADNGMTNWVIPQTLPLNLSKKELPIDPYIFGLWLGDGTTKAPHITAHIDDANFYMPLLEKAGIYARIYENSPSKIETAPNTRIIAMSLNQGGDLPSHMADSMAKRLKATLREDKKYIPRIYLEGSEEQRLELLKGLMDTDGTNGKGYVSFCNKNRDIIDGVYELFVSLGAKATIHECYNEYGIYWNVTSSTIFCPFKLQRKIESWNKLTGKPSIRRLNRTIFNIQEIEGEKECICINVDTPSHLFLAGKSMVPTHNSEEAASALIREKLYNWFTSTAYTRLQPGGSVILIMTRWENSDLTGRILEKMSRGGEQWEHLNFPAIAEKDEVFGDGIFERKTGEALWPEMWPTEELLRIKNVISEYDWASLYQQRPAPIGGGIFKKDWFRYYSMSGDYLILRSNNGAVFVNTHTCRTFCTIDVANKDKATSDFSVIAVWLLTGKGDLVLYDLIRDRMNWDVLVKKCVETARKYRPEYLGIENMGIGISLINELRNKNLAVRGLEPLGQKKQNRANAPLGIVVRMEGGKVYFPDGAPYLPDIEKEFLSFPKGDHDDIIDCASYMANELTRLDLYEGGDFCPYSISDNKTLGQGKPPRLEFLNNLLPK